MYTEIIPMQFRILNQWTWSVKPIVINQAITYKRKGLGAIVQQVRIQDLAKGGHSFWGQKLLT